MASYVNTEGFQPDKYFSRSWALLTREPGWFARVVLMWFANLVPILGPVGVGGYCAEWGRLTAWGVNSSPSRNGGTVGGYLRSGWRNVGISIVWGLAWGLIVSLIAVIPLVGQILSPILSLIAAAFGIIVHVAMLRAAIYQRIGAGFKGTTIWEMAKRDYMGLLRIFGIAIVGGIIVAIIATVVFTIAIVPSLGSLSSVAYEMVELDPAEYGDLDRIAELLAMLFVVMIPAGLIAGFIASFFGNILEILVFNALGLWTRQFNVPAWGDNDAPLPGTTPAYTPQYYPPQYPQQPYDSNAYQAPDQVPYAYGDTDYGTQTHGDVGQSYRAPQDQSQYPPQG